MDVIISIKVHLRTVCSLFSHDPELVAKTTAEAASSGVIASQTR